MLRGEDVTNVIKESDPVAGDAEGFELPEVADAERRCLLCKRTDVPLVQVDFEAGDHLCVECVGQLIDAAGSDVDASERRVALAAKQIVGVIKLHRLTEGEMWIALGTAGTACLNPGGERT